MTSQHTILAEIEHKFRFAGLEPGEYEIANLTMQVTYDFIPGRPAYTPRGEYAPIDPPDPAEVLFVSATLINGDGLDPPQGQVNEIAQEWIDSDHGYRQAVDYACEDVR